MDDRYKQLELNNVSDYIPIVNDIITNYCIDNGINENDILPNIWKDILIEIYLSVFKDNPILKEFNTNNANIYNKYNITNIELIYDLIYKRISYRHNKAIYLLDFCSMLGINKDTLYEWCNSLTSDLARVIKNDNERSLEGLLQDKSLNPMKVLPSLNHWHGWNEGSGHVTISHQKSQNVAQLPNFEPAKLSDNNG